MATAPGRGPAAEREGLPATPCIRPPTVDAPSSQNPIAPTDARDPFLFTVALCEAAQALPAGLPGDLRALEALGYVFSGGGLPEVCIANENAEHERSESELRDELTLCEALRTPFWLSINIRTMRHGRWWPARDMEDSDACTCTRGVSGGEDAAVAEAVPAYNSLIVGCGASGIGMHRDVFNATLVSTYLMLGIGRKHVLLLPSTAEGNALAKRLGGRGVHEQARTARVRSFPTRPPADLLDAVHAAG
jgi:hypothetical protein